MTNDAKLGLVLGLGLLIAIAIIFFQQGDTQPSASAQSPKTIAPAKAMIGPVE